MDLSVEHFGEFFAQLNAARRPFDWQWRLLRHVVEAQRWPDRIAAPTGAGKTAVIEVHVFAVALMAAGRTRVPRRLSLVVDRRALVDSQYDRARQVNEQLRAAQLRHDGVLSAVAGLLCGLRSGPTENADPISVAIMRGGAAPSTSWRDDPVACAVLCATPDMWGSRLLLRGYGISRHARSREAGLLAYDSVVVVDEAHLARQLVCTARRIEDLEGVADRHPAVPVLQVVEATATPGHVRGASDPAARPLSVIAVAPADLDGSNGDNAPLVQRLCAPKPVRVVADPSWPPSAASGKKLAKAVADEAVRLRARHGPTVACVLNTVSTALAVADELRSGGDKVEVLVGRMRPFDVASLRRRCPGLLSPEGDPGVDFVVATQTIEVGVDADFSALVTELAPGSAVAQRAGRVNRLGARPGAEVTVFGPEPTATLDKDVPPYRAADLAASFEWLGHRADDSAGLAPRALMDDPPPEQELRRTLLQRPELWDAWYWARTSDDLAAEPELELWLADDLDEDRDLAFVVRQGLPDEAPDAIALLRATPPREKEGFPVAINTARAVLEQRATRPAYVIRDEDVILWTSGVWLRPGDEVVIDASTPCFRSGVVDAEGSETAPDVLEARLGERDPFVLRIAPGAPIDTPAGMAASLLAELVAVCDAHPTDGRGRRAEMADVLGRYAAAAEGPTAEALRAAQRLLRDSRLADTEVTLGARTDDADPAWLVVADDRHDRADDELRQTWTPTLGQVLLADHAADVAQRTADIATRLALDEATPLLRRAASLHDEGKRDARFQSMLRAGDAAGQVDGEPIAKSGMRRRSQARAAWADAGLPSRWRHEQLSAAVAWELLGQEDPATRELVTRLVGTSHGRGRSSFPHVAGQLVGDDGSLRAAAETLFDEGAWDTLIERTQAAWGIWGCAYLEAVLRAADGQVSGEGR